MSAGNSAAKPPLYSSKHGRRPVALPARGGAGSGPGGGAGGTPVARSEGARAQGTHGMCLAYFIQQIGHPHQKEQTKMKKKGKKKKKGKPKEEEAAALAIGGAQVGRRARTHLPAPSHTHTHTHTHTHSRTGQKTACVRGKRPDLDTKHQIPRSGHHGPEFYIWTPSGPSGTKCWLGSRGGCGAWGRPRLSCSCSLAIAG